MSAQYVYYGKGSHMAQDLIRTQKRVRALHPERYLLSKQVTEMDGHGKVTTHLVTESCVTTPARLQAMAFARNHS